MSDRFAYQDILGKLTEFTKTEILHDAEEALDESVPLLELGILDSLAMVSVIKFIEKEFHVQVPQECVMPRNFDNLRHLSEMVLSLVNDQREKAA